MSDGKRLALAIVGGAIWIVLLFLWNWPTLKIKWNYWFGMLPSLGGVA